MNDAKQIRRWLALGLCLGDPALRPQVLAQGLAPDGHKKLLEALRSEQRADMAKALAEIGVVLKPDQRAWEAILEALAKDAKEKEAVLLWNKLRALKALCPDGEFKDRAMKLLGGEPCAGK